jgi:hypothetical protein
MRTGIFTVSQRLDDASFRRRSTTLIKVLTLCHHGSNPISHLLSLIPYEDLTPEPIELPPQQELGDCEHPDFSEYQFVPDVYP